MIMTMEKVPIWQNIQLFHDMNLQDMIHEVGKNVTAFKPGDRVTADNTEYCGDCYYCRREESNYCPTWFPWT